MRSIESKIIQNLSPLDLRAINDLLYLLNMQFFNTDIESNSDEKNLMSYFPEIDFSRMSGPITSLEAIKVIIH